MAEPKKYDWLAIVTPDAPMDLSQLVVTQIALRNMKIVEDMAKHVANGGKFDPTTLAQYAAQNNLSQPAGPMVVCPYEDVSYIFLKEADIPRVSIICGMDIIELLLFTLAEEHICTRRNT